MSRYSCHDDDEHRRQAESDYRWRGRPDYEMQDRQYDDECARIYMDQFRAEERRDEERRAEEASEERRARERAEEQRHYEDQCVQQFEPWPSPPYPEQEWPEPPMPRPEGDDPKIGEAT
jgi:hypothetical protein